MFTNRSRLMLIAAHPDDESLACSVVLQRAVHAGADIRVIYATDGENNPWPQRVLEHKWRINESDRERWGKLRRAEALAALALLGVAESDAIFLALPDQKLSEVLIFDSRGARERFAALIMDWTPTHLLVPSISDTHPDHNALGVMLRLVWAEYFSDQTRMSMWSYVVHGKSPAFFDRAETIGQTVIETAVKLRAISCHKTQLKLSRKRFLDHAKQPEHFVRLGSRETIDADGAISSISRGPRSLWIKVERSLKLMRSRNAALFVLRRDDSCRMRCVRTQVPVRSSRIEIVDVATNKQLAGARYRGDASTGTLAIPLDMFSANETLFVKLERRGWFLDEAGWLELPSTVRAEPIVVGDDFFADRDVDDSALLRK
jgi:LmbE family N-acetylglucosaminyl deacetylase